MRYIFGFCVLLLSSAAFRTSETSYCRDCGSMRWILKYFNPPYEDQPKGEFEDCSDPCVLNETLLEDGGKEYSEQPCFKPYKKCSEAGEEYQYRSIDGSCNNLDQPHWGMSNSCLRRFLRHDYGDGVSLPRKSCLKEDLPNSRDISNLLHKETRLWTIRHTLHFLEWGQVIAHDVSYANTHDFPETGPGSCCFPHPRNDDKCMATEILDDNDFYKGKRKCLPLARTLSCPLCKGGVRQVLNAATSYHDLSVIYGSTDKMSMSLRSRVNGTLLTQYVPGVGSLPPPIDKIGRCISMNASHRCFNAGDDRINSNLLLTSYTIILLRHHNHICMKLKEQNPHWDDHRLFNVAREINIAQAQMVSFGYYVPTVLGRCLTRDFQLDVLHGNGYTHYDNHMEGFTYDEFTTVANRYGHSLIPNVFLEKDPDSGDVERIHIKDYFHCPFDFYGGQLDRLALGMLYTKSRYHDLLVAGGVRNFLFLTRGKHPFDGGDLASASIERGRDHGIPGYTYFLKYFFGYEVHSFCDLIQFMPRSSIKKMRQLYRSVHDVDPYTGLLAEYHMDNAIVGPTTAAILLLQYRNMKFGDRYYFEHRRKNGFTPKQLAEIKKKTNLAQIICKTTRIRAIQRDVFLLVSDGNPLVPCDTLPAFDFRLWKER